MHGPKCGIYLGFGIFGFIAGITVTAGGGFTMMALSVAGLFGTFGGILVFGIGLVLFITALIVIYRLAKAMRSP
jgi:hypothetical protein